MVDVMDKIVNLEFNNKDFEENAQTSLSTLDKLKKALNFDGAASGLEKVKDSVKGISLEGLTNAVDTVANRFSTMGIVATTALVNITNRAVDAGIQLVKSLTIDNITSGFQEYEDSLKSINKIMYALPDLSMDQIQEQIRKLDWYADETAYDFQGMTRAVSSFVAQEIPLDESAKMIQGVANMAGLAGVEAKNATHAFDGFAKAIGAQYMSQINWSWIKTAGMETAATKKELIEAGLAVGTLYKDSKGVIHVSKQLMKNAKGLKDDVVSVANFTTTLSSRWLSGEVMQHAFTEMSKYSDLVKEFQTIWEDLTGEYLSASEVMGVLDDSTNMSAKHLDVLTQATSNLLGKSVDATGALHYLNEEISESAKAGFKSAQEYRTFSDAIEATSVAVTTAWSKVFQAIFGDAEQAKVTWTRLGNWLWDEFASPFVDFADVVEEWSRGGGREDLIEGFANIGNAYSTVKQTLSDTFEDFLRPLKTITVHTKELVTELDPLTGEANKVWKLVNKTVTETKEISNFKPFTGGLKNHLDLETKLVDVYDEEWTIFDGIQSKIEAMSTKLREYTDRLFVYNEETGETEPSERFLEVLEKLSRIFNGALNGIGLFADAIKVVIDAVRGLFDDEMSDMGDQVLDVAADFGDWLTDLRKNGKLIDSFRGKVEKVTNALKPIANFLGYIIPKAVEKFKETDLLGALSLVFDEAAGALGRSFHRGGIFTALGEGISELGKVLKEYVGIDISWITDFLGEDFKQFDEFLPKLQPLINFITGLGDAFGESFTSAGGGLPGLLSGIFDSISGGLQAIADTGLLSSIGQGIDEFGEALKKATGIDLTWFTSFVNDVLGGIEEKIPALQPLLDFFADLGKNFKETYDEKGGGLKGGIAATLDSITGALTALSDTFTGLTGTDFSGAVNTVNGILNGFGTVLDFVAGAVTGLWNGLTGLVDWFGKQDWSDLKSVFDGISPFLTQVWELVKTVLSDIGSGLSANSDGKGMWALMQNIVLFFSTLAGIKIVGILNNVKEMFATVSDVLSGFSESSASKFKEMAEGILMLVAAIAIMSVIDSNKLKEVGIALAAMIAMVELAIVGLAKISQAFSASSGGDEKKGFLEKILGRFMPEDTTGIKNMTNALLKVGAALLIVAVAVKVLASIKGNVWESIGAMTVVLAEMVAVVAILGKLSKQSKQLVSGVGGLIAIAAAVWILAKAIEGLAEVGNIPAVFVSSLIIAGLTAALVGLAKSLSGTTGVAAAGFALIEISAAMLILSGVLAIIGKLQETYDMANVILYTGGALVVLAGSLIILAQVDTAKVIASAAAMILVSIALLALIPTLYALSDLYTSGNLDNVLVEFAKALFVMVGVLAVLSVLPSLGVLAAAAAMVIAAAAIFVLSAAVNLFGTDLAKTAIDNMSKMLEVLISLSVASLLAAPVLLLLSVSIIALGASLLILAPGILLITGMIEAMTALANTVIAVVVVLEQSQFGKMLLEGLFNGFDENSIIGKVANVVGWIVGAFKRLFKINSPSLLMKEEIGENLMSGMAEGIDASSYKVENSIDNWGEDALKLFETWSGEMSESGDKVMPDIASAFDTGSFDVLGSIDMMGADSLANMDQWMGLLGGSGDNVMSNLANGIDMKSYLLNNSIDGMGDSAYTTMSSTMSRLSDAVNEDLVTEPVITPTIDLSKVKQGVATINEIFGQVQLNKLNQLSSSNGSNRSSNVTYVQNNYSPKAMSRTEIYRQTKVLIKG